jgi:hypothetical protein
MKSRYIFLAFIVSILNIYTLSSQDIVTVEGVTLSINERTVIDQRISRYSTFSIDKKSLTNTVRRSDSETKIRLQINETLDWTINLELNDMRAADYKSAYTTDAGTFEFAETFVVNTFKGITSDGKVARFTIDDDTFYGVILADNYHYTIRPIDDYTHGRSLNSSNKFVVYSSKDVIPSDENFDYIEDVLDAPEYNLHQVINQSSNIVQNFDIRTSSCPNYYLRIATDADFEFHQARNGTTASSPAPTNNHILSVLNIVEGVYERTFGMRFSITYQHVYTTSNQPYTSDNSSVLLNQFRNHWNANNNYSRNIAHLFTGKSLENNVVGRAWRGQLHHLVGSSAYALSRNRVNMYQTVAHEIGHNLNAVDVNLMTNVPAQCECDTWSASVMCQGDKHPTLWFCDVSINEISTFIQRNRADLYGVCGPFGPHNPVCYSGSSYTFVGVPDGSVTWLINSGPFSFSPNSNVNVMNGTSVTIYRTGTSMDNGILYVLAGNGATSILSISPCSPPPVISGPTTVCIGQTARFSVLNTTNQVIWTKSSNLQLTVENDIAIIHNNGLYTNSSQNSLCLSSTGWIKATIVGTGIVLERQLITNTDCIFDFNLPSSAIAPILGNPVRVDVSLQMSSTNAHVNWRALPDIGFHTNNLGTYAQLLFFQDGLTTVTASAVNACGTYSRSKVINISGIWAPDPRCLFCNGTGIINNNRCIHCPPVALYSLPITENNQINTFPNPVSEILNINLSQEPFARERTLTTHDIRLYDTHGNLVRQARATGGNVQMNVSNLPIGIYYLHIYDGTTESPEIQQIIIER